MNLTDNDYDIGIKHGIELGLSYVRGYAIGTQDTDVLNALNKYIEHFEGMLEVMQQREVEDTE